MSNMLHCCYISLLFTHSQRTETGIIFMAIDNIYDKCKKSTDPALGKADWETKLNRIRVSFQHFFCL